MRVDVVMPQMGESIAEGTITRWLKKQGERVERDEPILEISTDKVDAEIPAPASGVLVELRGGEGETVEVNSVLGVIDTEGGEAAAAKAAAPKAAAPKADAPAAAPAPAKSAEPASAPAAPARRGKAFVSPVVRKIADEHGIDPSTIAGSGAGGRVIAGPGRQQGDARPYTEYFYFLRGHHGNFGNFTGAWIGIDVSVANKISSFGCVQSTHGCNHIRAVLFTNHVHYVL